jgi:hypothetical protein
MRQMLEYQADRIEAVLAHHKVPARVTGGTVTPRWIRFQVVPALGARIASITGLAEELAAALDAPTVRVARQGATIAVEVPRDDPHPVRLIPLLRGMRNVPPVTAVLGIAEDGVPLLIRLPSRMWPTFWWRAPPAAARRRCCGRWSSLWRISMEQVARSTSQCALRPATLLPCDLRLATCALS